MLSFSSLHLSPASNPESGLFRTDKGVPAWRARSSILSSIVNEREVLGWNMGVSQLLMELVVATTKDSSDHRSWTRNART